MQRGGLMIHRNALGVQKHRKIRKQQPKLSRAVAKDAFGDCSSPHSICIKKSTPQITAPCVVDATLVWLVLEFSKPAKRKPRKHTNPERRPHASIAIFGSHRTTR
jgi:hypothetical protein